jgi:hypothetical protein
MGAVEDGDGMSQEWHGKMLLRKTHRCKEIVDESEGNHGLGQYFEYAGAIQNLYRKLNDKKFRQERIERFRNIIISPAYDELVDVGSMMSKEELSIFDIARIELRCWFKWSGFCIYIDWGNLKVAKWQAVRKDDEPEYEFAFYQGALLYPPISKGMKFSSLAVAQGLYKPARGMKEAYLDGNVMNVTASNLATVPASRGRDAYRYPCHQHPVDR